MSAIIRSIRTDLKKSVDAKSQKSFQRFFKEKITYYGVNVGTVGKIAAKHWNIVRLLDKKQIFALCEELLRSDYCEEAFVVSFWVPKLADQFVVSDLKVFKRWISLYINNWAKCDGFCNHSVGEYLMRYPAKVSELKQWARSNNIWLKRAAAVSLIVPAKRGMFLQHVFDIADILLLNRHDMVQKGYGWMLKEASRHHQHEVFDFVLCNRATMPRTALRYAIELMPKSMKAEAMKKDQKARIKKQR